jgi:gliding motility-associated-like protein
MQFLYTACPNDGQYTIVNYTAGCWGNGWHTTSDHTGDPNGYFMLINASYQPSDFYVRTIDNLCDGTTYLFSAWVLNMGTSPAISPNISFTIEKNDGTILGRYTTGDIPVINPTTWKQYGFYFTTPAGTSSVVLRMHNNAPGGIGNDLALDDITFSPAGPKTVISTVGITGNTITTCANELQLVSSVENCYLTNGYQWQQSADNIGWNDINGANAATYDAPVSKPGKYYYRLTVAQQGNIANSNCRVNSNVLAIQIVQVTPIQNSIYAVSCPGTAYTLPSGKLVYASGTYSDTLRNIQGCDSVVNTVNLSRPPVSHIAKEATICDGDAYQLSSGKTISITGIYLDTLRSLAGCDSLITQVDLTVDKVTTIDQQVAICKDSSMLLSPGNNFTRYLWSTGATQSSLMINTIGRYTVSITDVQGCSATDTFVVTQLPVPDLHLNHTATICEGQTTTLDAGGGFGSYQWSDGSTQQKITIAATGTYWVRVKDFKQCTASDTVVINTTAPLPVGFITVDTLKCNYATITLQPANDYDDYLWSTGAQTKSIDVMASGSYWLQVTDKNGCSNKEYIKVEDSACKEGVFIPNAFTPNGDGANDFFKPIIQGVVSDFHFIIFDRWGAKVFETANSLTGWNGTINGNAAPMGAYIYTLVFANLDSKSVQKKSGTFLLIR